MNIAHTRLVRARAAALSVTAAVLAGCASAPTHYYTLLAPPTDGSANSASRNGRDLRFELSVDRVPAQVDQPQLVVREGAQRVAVLDGERWIAPLGDEVRAALAADLAQDLPGQDVTGLIGTSKPALRIRLDMRRFDSFPGDHAAIEASWSIRVPARAAGAGTGAGAIANPNAGLACTSVIRENVGPGFAALVGGHQRALARLAEEIAAAARPLLAGEAGNCP